MVEWSEQVQADHVKALLAQGDRERARAVLRQMRPEDIGAMLNLLSDEERVDVMHLLEDEEAGRVLADASDDVAVELVRDLGRQRAADILEEMATDEAAEILGDMPAQEAGELIHEMEAEEAEDVRGVLKYPEGTAGRLMTDEFVALPEHLTAQQAIERLRQISPDAETIYYVYVTDEAGRLTGVLSLRDLIVAAPDTPLSEIAIPEVIAVPAAADQEEAAKLVSRYDLLALPVVESDGRLVGIITVDDVVDVLEEEATEDIQKMGAISGGDEALYAPAPTALSKRLPWMAGVLVVYLAVPAAIAPFRKVIADIAVLAMFMPVISAIGGNCGSQALAVTIRGLALHGTVRARDVLRVLKKEAVIGIGMGIALGVVIASVAAAYASLSGAYSRGSLLGLVVGLSLLANVLIASILGGLVPVLLKKVGLDPALMTGALLTWLMDLFGFFAFLSLSAVFLVPRA